MDLEKEFPGIIEHVWSKDGIVLVRLTNGQTFVKKDGIWTTFPIFDPLTIWLEVTRCGNVISIKPNIESDEFQDVECSLWIKDQQMWNVIVPVCRPVIFKCQRYNKLEVWSLVKKKIHRYDISLTDGTIFKYPVYVLDTIHELFGVEYQSNDYLMVGTGDRHTLLRVDGNQFVPSSMTSFMENRHLKSIFIGRRMHLLATQDQQGEITISGIRASDEKVIWEFFHARLHNSTVDHREKYAVLCTQTHGTLIDLSTGHLVHKISFQGIDINSISFSNTNTELLFFDCGKMFSIQLFPMAKMALRSVLLRSHRCATLIRFLSCHLFVF